MKRITRFAFALLFAFGATLAHAGEDCRSACADGHTWSSEAGSCVRQTVSS